MAAATNRAARIAALNDTFRKHCRQPGSPQTGKVMITRGVNALGRNAVLEILDKVAAFDAFDEDNDPHHEHDFGAIDHDDRKLFFKIDYFDESMTFGSEDPTDPAKTMRVITIMLSDEY
jgi:hypothetical protein